MYFKNSFGEVYINKQNEVVLYSNNQTLSFKSSNQFLVQSMYNDYVKILLDLEKEVLCIERLKELLDDDTIWRLRSILLWKKLTIWVDFIYSWVYNINIERQGGERDEVRWHRKSRCHRIRNSSIR